MELRTVWKTLQKGVHAMIEQDKRYGNAPLLLPRSSRGPAVSSSEGALIPTGLNLSDAGLDTSQVVRQKFNQVALKAAKLPH